MATEAATTKQKEDLKQYNPPHHAMVLHEDGVPFTNKPAPEQTGLV